MRYRRLTYRYTVVTNRALAWPLAPPGWGRDLSTLLQGRWRPDADVCETAGGIDIVVELAGVEERDVDIQLFDDAVVVEGERRLPACDPEAVYHAAAVRQGPFRLEVALPAAVDAADVEATYDRGLLRISLKKAGSGR
jgi:HSP20 family protein